MIRDIRLNVDSETSKYPADDIPKKVLRWIEKNKRAEEPEREDLREGQVVVILEGAHASMRAVFLKRLPHNLVLCSGPSGVSGVPFVVLNQRYVLPVSVFLDVRVDVPVKEEALREMQAKAAEDAVDINTGDLVDASSQEKVDSAISSEISKRAGLKAYFSTPFSVPRDMDPLEMHY